MKGPRFRGFRNAWRRDAGYLGRRMLERHLPGREDAGCLRRRMLKRKLPDERKRVTSWRLRNVRREGEHVGGWCDKGKMRRTVDGNKLPGKRKKS